MYTSIQSNIYSSGILNFALPKLSLSTSQITSEFHNDFIMIPKCKQEATFVYQLKLKLEEIKSQMHFQSWNTNEQVGIILKISIHKIATAIVDCETILNMSTLKVKAPQKKILKDLKILKQDIAIIHMYFEV